MEQPGKLTPEELKQLAVLRLQRQQTNKTAFVDSRRRLDCIRRIQEALIAGPRTVPELSEATGLPAVEALWFVTAMKKYGMVSEGEKDGSYFRYVLETAEILEPDGGDEASTES